MSTSGTNHYSGRGKASTSREELGRLSSGWLSEELVSIGMRFRDGYSLLAEAEDITYDPQVFVELNACAECPARFTSAAQQAGQLHEAQILEAHDVSAVGKRFGFCDWILRPVEVSTSQVGFLRGQRRRSFFRLIAEFKLTIGIDFWSQRFHRGKGKESRSQIGRAHV